MIMIIFIFIYISNRHNALIIDIPLCRPDELQLNNEPDNKENKNTYKRNVKKKVDDEVTKTLCP